MQQELLFIVSIVLLNIATQTILPFCRCFFLSFLVQFQSINWLNQTYTSIIGANSFSVFMYIIFWNVIFLDFRIKVFWIKCKDINFEWNTFLSKLWCDVVMCIFWNENDSFPLSSLFQSELYSGQNGQSLQN